MKVSFWNGYDKYYGADMFHARGLRTSGTVNITLRVRYDNYIGQVVITPNSNVLKFKVESGSLLMMLHFL